MNNTAEHILKIYKGTKVPIVIETQKLEITKKNYIVPIDMTLQEFHCTLRKKIKLTKQQSIVLFTKNILPVQSRMIGSLYDEFKDEDDILYIMVRCENTFG